MFEQRMDRVFTTPSIGFLHNLRYEAEAFGFPKAVTDALGVPQHMAENVRTHTELRKRGVRPLIGSDYGLPWQGHGTNARDIEHFTTYLGYSPVEALRCATRYGFEAMGRGHELGLIRPGFVADLLLVRGDPTRDVKLLQDSSNLLCIMKNGVCQACVISHPSRHSDRPRRSVEPSRRTPEAVSVSSTRVCP